MKKTYYYSLLQYSPSLALAEKINVGILYVFVEEQKLVLDTPAYLQRVKDTFPNIDLHHFKTSLKHYSQLADRFNSGLFPLTTPQNIIYQVYGQPNSNSFQFTDCQLGFYRQYEDLIEKNHHLYFHSYQTHHIPANNPYILNQLKLYFEKLNVDKNLIRSQNAEIDKVKFDYSWKNGRTNFIQSVSFDYERQAYIKKRADEWTGKIVNLQDILIKENYNLDFFTIAPQNIDFIPTYQLALDKLKRVAEKTAEHIHFYEKDDIPEYVANLAAHIHG